MECSSPPLFSSSAAIEDRILNMPPRPSHHLNHPSVELVKEIAALEVEIVRLERYLLSLYRTAFKHHLPTILGNHVQETSKDYNALQGRSSPTSALTGPDESVQVAIPKASSRREKKGAYSRRRSLAAHLGNSHIENAIVCPDKLSEDIIKCISSIYCKLANPVGVAHKGNSISSTPSFCSSSTFSPRNLSGSWSPQCNDIEVTDSEEVKQDNNGPYAAMVEVIKICLDDESYSYAATMLQHFRSLVKSLEIVDVTKMRHEEKLVFWINIHNALVMHAYLAYGTQNYIKNTTIMKATYNVGGLCVNALDIQSDILGIKSHYSAPWLETLLSPGKKLMTGSSKHVYAIEYPEPVVHFALSSGAFSDPAIRVYSAKSVHDDLKVAKEEFIQATVYVHQQTKIYLPKILRYYAKDTSLGMTALLEVVCECLPETQQKIIRNLNKNRPEKYVYWLEQSSCFRYLIQKEIS